jgi:hypothetical protein
LRCESFVEDVPDPTGSTCVLALVEDRAKVCVGQNGIAHKVRVVLLDIFPDSLLSLGLASAIDIPSSVDLGVGWVCPSLVDGSLGLVAAVEEDVKTNRLTEGSLSAASRV